MGAVAGLGDLRRVGEGTLGMRLAEALEPMPAAPTKPSTRSGEAFTWRLRFLGAVDAGRARLALTPSSRPGGYISVVGEAEAAGLAKAFTGGLHDDYKLVLDGTTLVPRQMEIIETGYRERNLTIKLNGRKVDVTQRKGTQSRSLTGNLPTEPLEPVSVLLQLRAARLQQGDKLELILLDGSAFYQGSITVEGRESLTTAMGTHPAIKLACRGERIGETGLKLGRPPRTATMWLTDDARRLPLLVRAQTDLGSGDFELTSYDPGRRPPTVPTKLTGIAQH